MKTFVILTLLTASLASCNRDCSKVQATMFEQEKKHLSKTVETSEATIAMNYFPHHLVPGHEVIKEKNKGKVGVYYFTCVVEVKKNIELTNIVKQQLLMGNAEWFAASTPTGTLMPMIVEPIIKGSNNRFEYLVAFDAAAIDAAKENAEIIFKSPVLTEKDIQFTFEKKSIILLEKLSC